MNVPPFGVDEGLRITLVALASLNIGAICGRLRHYSRARGELRREIGTEAESATAASVVVFLSGYLIILASLGWRIIQLYHQQPVSLPLFSMAVGLVISLLGLHYMGKHLAAKIFGSARDELRRPDSAD